MRPRLHRALARGLPLLAMPLLAACTTGLLYTHTVLPLTTNFDRTPAATDTKSNGDIRHISIPVEGVSLDVAWSSNAIGDIALRSGLEEVYYADIETLSVLTIWNQYTAHIYGKPKAVAPAAAAATPEKAAEPAPEKK